MNILPIDDVPADELLVPEDDVVLNSEAFPVEDLEGLRSSGVLERMRRLLDEKRGVGLAAPQVGIPLAFFVFRFGERVEAVVNPVILKARGWDVDEEGCLSRPGLWFRIGRPELITAAWTDEYGHPRKEKLSGLSARCFQHETDHLRGILIGPGRENPE